MLKRISWPLSISFVLLSIYAFLRLGGFAQQSKGLRYLLAAALIAASVAIARLVNLLLFDILFQKRKEREAPGLLRVLVSIVIYALLISLIFGLVLEQDLSGLLATSAVVSVIIGLALQDILGNFFAGVALHIEQPFHIGDAIKLADVVGRVESVTWRTTTVRTNNNSIVMYPNGKVARETVEIYPYGNDNRRVLQFPAPYGVPPETIIPLVREAIRTVPNVIVERTPVVRMAEFAESSITYEILYWVKDYMWVPDMDAKMRERIWYAYRRSGIEIPFPHRQIIHVAAPVDSSDSDRVEEIISRVELFEPLSPEEREDLAKSVGRYLYAPGEVVLRRGEAGDSMFIITRGIAEVRLPSPNGAAQTLAVLSVGNFFGEMALFTGEPRTADVNAVEELELIEIRKVAIEQLLQQNEKLAEAFSARIAELQARLAEHTRRSAEQSEQLQPKRILQRIRSFFKLR